MREMPFTPIYETARNELNITRDEYALCSCVQFWSSDPESRIPGWCDEPKENIASWVGITRPGLYGMIKRMVEKDLLEQHPKGGHLRITSRWFQTISNARADIESRKATVKKVYNTDEQKDGEQCKESLQSDVKKVYKKRKESLHANTKVLSNKIKGSNTSKSVADATRQKEKKFSEWMITDFEAAYLKAFPGIGAFNWQKKHFSDAGLSGLYATFKSRIEKIQPGTTATEEQIRQRWIAFLNAAAAIDWIIEKGFFDPCKLKSQFNTIAETHAAAKKKTVNGHSINGTEPKQVYKSPEFFNADKQ